MATSTWPARTWRRPSLPPVWRSSRVSPSWARTVRVSAGAKATAAVGNAEMATRPTGSWADTSASAASIRARISAACADQPPARVGQLGRPRAAVQQRRPGLPLQRGELLGHRGRRVAERGGGGGDRAALGELPQQAQPVYV